MDETYTANSLYRKDSTLNKKSFSFALRIIDMVRFVRQTQNEHILSKQIVRSGTAIGALVRESEFAQSKADFISKLSIALKEANETDYWLCLLNKSGYIDDKAFASISNDCGELIALLISSVKTAKSSISNT